MPLIDLSPPPRLVAEHGIAVAPSWVGIRDGVIAVAYQLMRDWLSSPFDEPIERTQRLAERKSAGAYAEAVTEAGRRMTKALDGVMVYDAMNGGERGRFQRVETDQNGSIQTVAEHDLSAMARPGLPFTMLLGGKCFVYPTLRMGIGDRITAAAIVAAARRHGVSVRDAGIHLTYAASRHEHSTVREVFHDHERLRLLSVNGAERTLAFADLERLAGARRVLSSR